MSGFLFIYISLFCLVGLECTEPLWERRHRNDLRARESSRRSLMEIEIHNRLLLQ